MNYLDEAKKSLRENTVYATARMQIYPDDETQKRLLKTMRRFRRACDIASHHARKCGLSSPAKLHKALYHEIREKCGLPSQLTESVFRVVAAAYRAQKTNEISTLAVFRKNMAVWQVGRDCVFKGDAVRLKVLDGRVLVPFERTGQEQYFNGDWKLGTARKCNIHSCCVP